MRTERSRTRHAFTLVELLVVVAIIVILIAMLMPALERAMSEAQAAACGSNSRQIGTLVQYYLGDNNRVFPTYAYDPWHAGDKRMNHTWAGKLRSYTTTTTTTDPADPFKLVFCPNDAVQTYDYNNISYGYNSLALGDDWYNFWVQSSRVVVPQLTIVTADSNDDQQFDSIIGPLDSGWSAYPVGGRHRDKANVLMADGHVERADAGMLNAQDRKSPNDSTYWWDVEEKRMPGLYSEP